MERGIVVVGEIYRKSLDFREFVLFGTLTFASVWFETNFWVKTSPGISLTTDLTFAGITTKYKTFVHSSKEYNFIASNSALYTCRVCIKLLR